jgi:hypothetical protein
VELVDWGIDRRGVRAAAVPVSPAAAAALRMALPGFLPKTTLVSDNWATLATALAKPAQGDGTNWVEGRPSGAQHG